MLIRTFHTDYEVISRVVREADTEIFVCGKYPAGTDSKTEYTIARIKNPEIAERLVSFFTKLDNLHEFTDFIEFFSSEGKTHFVYLHSPRQTLSDKLTNEKCDFFERLEMGKNLLERMVLLNMPYFIQCNVLTPANCTVARNLSVYFNYTFTDCLNFEHVRVQHVGAALKNTFNLLFRHEIELKSCSEINQYLQYLSDGDYESYMDLLCAYNEVYVKLSVKPPEEIERPNIFIFSLWESAKKILHIMSKVLLVVLLGAAILYLICSVIQSFESLPSAKAIEYIGDVKLQ